MAEDYGSYDFLSKFHKKYAHKNLDNMMHALSQAELVTPGTRRVVKTVIENCIECKKFGKSFMRPKTTLPKVSTTNEIITWDLKDLKNGSYVLWMVDSFSRFLKGCVIPNKRKETVLEKLYYEWEFRVRVFGLIMAKNFKIIRCLIWWTSLDYR